MESAEIVKHHLNQAQYRELNFKLNSVQKQIVALDQPVNISLNANREHAAIDEIVALVSVEGKTVDDIIPISFFQNFKATVSSELESGVINGWKIIPLKTDNGQYIYQFSSSYHLLVGGRISITLTPVNNDKYSATLLNGYIQLTQLKVLRP